MNRPVRVAVTGAAGQIGYSLLFRIATGEMLGPDQPVILQMLEVPDALGALRGVAMELADCAFPLLAGMVQTSDPEVAFRDADYALLVGSRPRTAGIERRDLLAFNAEIFQTQGRALDAVAAREVKVLVVGNPANTNCYIAMKSAPGLAPGNFTAMMRLDHNRCVAMLAERIGKPVEGIERAIVLGNHSLTMYPDYHHARVDSQSVKDLVGDDAWYRNEFIPTVAQRGTEVIAARGRGSAASAASAAVDHIRDWVMGTDERWVTMGIASDGSYGVPQEIICGVPVVCAGGSYQLVRDVDLNDFSRERLARSVAELDEERAAIDHLLERD